MNNRMWNVKNPNQGNRCKVLCVCSAGLLRSPTAAVVLSSEPYNCNTRSCGIDIGHALIPIDDVLLAWADVVICMDYSQCERVREMGFDGTIYNYSIPDEYGYMDSGLVDLIKEREGMRDQYLFDAG